MVKDLMEPMFYLRIVDREEIIAQVPGGGPLEADLIDLLARSIVARGVGILKTSAHVEQDIRDGIAEALKGLKDQTKYLVRPVISK